MMRISILLGVVLLGCSVDPCHPGQKTDALGFCVSAAAPGTAAGGAAGSAPLSEDAGAGGQAGSAVVCEEPSEFGDACTQSSDCHCVVDFCAIMPGETSGVCTHTGCIDDPSVCPVSWSCFDLSVFNPTLPAICVAPK